MNPYSCTNCTNYPSQSKDAEPLVVDRYGVWSEDADGFPERTSPRCSVYGRCRGDHEWRAESVAYRAEEMPAMWNVGE